MTDTGRFDTSIKTKIKTPHGTVLKISKYEEDCTSPDIEYKTRTKCSVCGAVMDCLCFNDDNATKPYDDVIECLNRVWICGNADCLIQYEKENDPERYDELVILTKGDTHAMAEIIADSIGCIEEGDVCGV